MSSWPPQTRLPSISYMAVSRDGSSVETACTEIDFVGTMKAVNSTGPGAVQISMGMQELTEDPASPQAGDCWILKEATRKISHSLPFIGLTTASVTYRFYLKYRTSLNTTLSFELT